MAGLLPDSPFSDALSYYKDFQSRLPDQYKNAISPQDFAKMSEENHGPDFSSLKGDTGLVRQFADTANRAVEGTLGAVTAPAGRAFYSATGGDPNVGEQQGRDLSKSLAAFGTPALAGVAVGLNPESWIPLAGGAVLSGLSTYGETGSKGEAALNTAESLILPAIGSKAGKIAGSLLPKGAGNISQVVTQGLGNLAGVGAANEAAHQGEFLYENHQLDTSRSPAEILRENAVGALGFSPLIGLHLANDVWKSKAAETESNNAQGTTEQYSPKDNGVDIDNPKDKSNSLFETEANKGNLTIPEEQHLPVEISNLSEPKKQQTFLGEKIGEPTTTGETQPFELEGGPITHDKSPLSFIADTQHNNMHLANHLARVTDMAEEDKQQLLQQVRDKSNDPASHAIVRNELANKLADFYKPKPVVEVMSEAVNSIGQLQHTVSAPPAKDAPELINNVKIGNNNIYSLENSLQKLASNLYGEDFPSHHLSDENVKALIEWGRQNGQDSPQWVMEALDNKIRLQAQDSIEFGKKLINHINGLQFAKAEAEEIRSVKPDPKNPTKHLTDEQFQNHPDIFKGDEASWVDEVNEKFENNKRADIFDKANADGRSRFRSAMELTLREMLKLPLSVRESGKNEEHFKRVYQAKLANSEKAAEQTEKRKGLTKVSGVGDETSDQAIDRLQDKEAGNDTVNNSIETGEMDKNLGLEEPSLVEDKKELPTEIQSNKQVVAKQVLKELETALNSPGGLKELVKKDFILNALKSIGVKYALNLDKPRGIALKLALKYTLEGINARGEFNSVSPEQGNNISRFHEELEKLAPGLTDTNTSEYRVTAFKRADAIIKAMLEAVPRLPDGQPYELGKISAVADVHYQDGVKVIIKEKDFKNSKAEHFIATVGEVARQFANNIGMGPSSIILKDFAQRIAAKIPLDALKNLTLKDLVSNAGWQGVLAQSKSSTEHRVLGIASDLGDPIIFADTLAHELVHAVDYYSRFNPGKVPGIVKAFANMRELISTLTDMEKQAILWESLKKSYKGVDEAFLNQRSVYGLTNPDEFLAVYGASYLHSLVSDHPGLADVYKHSNSVIRETIKHVGAMAKSTLQILKDALSRIIFKGDSSKVQPFIKSISDKLNKNMAKIFVAEQEVQAAIKATKLIEARINPISLIKTYRNEPITANFLSDLEIQMHNEQYAEAASIEASPLALKNPKDILDTGEDFLKSWFGKQGIIEKYFMRPAQLAIGNNLTNLSRQLHTYGPVAKEIVQNVTKSWGHSYQDGKFVKDTKFNWISGINSNERLAGPDGLFSQMARWGNLNSEKLGDAAWLNTPQKVMQWAKNQGKTITSQTADLLATGHQHMVQSFRDLMVNRLKLNYDTASRDIALSIFRQDQGLKNLPDEHLRALSDKIVSAARLKTDPSKQNEYQQTIAQLQQVPGLYDPNIKSFTPAVLKAFDLADDRVKTIGEFGLKFLGPTGKGIGAYMPEQRPGQFLVHYDDKGVTGSQGFATRQLAERGEKRLLDEGKTNTRIQNKDQYRDMHVGDSALDAIFKMETDAFEQMLSSLPQAQADSIRRQYEPLQASRDEISGRGLSGNMLTRNFAPGRETIDMLPETIKALSRQSTLLAREMTSLRASLALTDPALLMDDKNLEYAHNWVKNTLYPVGTDFHKFNTAVAMYFTAYNTSTLMIEGVQGLQLIPALFAEHGAGPLESFKHMGAGYKFALDYITGKFEDPTKTPKQYNLLAGANRLGLLQTQFNDSLINEPINYYANLKNVTDLKKPLESASSFLQNAGYLMYKGAEQFHNISAIVNKVHSIGASISMLDAHPEIAGKTKSSQLTHQDYLKFAQDVNNVTTSSTGGAGRSPTLSLAIGKAAPILNTLNVLQGYATTMMSFQFRLMKNAIIKNELDPKQQKRAIQALITMTATNVALAGMFGIQPLGAITGVMQTLMGKDVDLETEMRKGLLTLFHEDAQSGSLLTDIALKGLPTALTPVDVSGRLGMGQIFGVDASGDMNITNALGAPMSMLNQITRGLSGGAQALAEGNTDAAMESASRALPTVLRNKPNLLFDDGNVRDKSGRIIGQLDGTDKVLAALGFQPKKVSDLRDTERAVKASENAKKTQNEELYNQASQLWKQNDPQGALGLLKQRAAIDPTFDLKQGVREMIRHYQNHNLPVDPLRNAPAGSNLRQVYGDQNHTPEFDRLKQQDMLIGSLGVPGMKPISARQFMKAKLVDSLMSEDPTIDRDDALEQLRKQGIH